MESPLVIMSSPPVTHSHKRGRSEVWAQVTRLPRPAEPASRRQSQLGFGKQFGHGDRHVWLLFMMSGGRPQAAYTYV